MLRSSRIFIDEKGTLMVINNTAKNTGGGIYFYHSLLLAQGLVVVQDNRASTYGGGIHCISSTIVLIYSQYIELANNEAVYGGGICLEASSKFYIKQQSSSSKKVLRFIENSACYGGAIYVLDNTTTGTCSSSPVQLQTVTTTLQSRCFFQILKPVTENNSYPSIEDYMYFERNFANNTSGADLYGGLLDRCTVYKSGKNEKFINVSNRIPINISSSSDPVRVCLCTWTPAGNLTLRLPNCTISPPVKQIIKGSDFTIELAAVDHVNRKVNATIIGSLESRNGHLGGGSRNKLLRQFVQT